MPGDCWHVNTLKVFLYFQHCWDSLLFNRWRWKKERKKVRQREIKGKWGYRGLRHFLFLSVTITSKSAFFFSLAHCLHTHVTPHLLLYVSFYTYLFKLLSFYSNTFYNHPSEGQFTPLKMWQGIEEPLWTWGSSFKSRLRDPSSEGSWLESWSTGFKGGHSSRCLCRPEARSSQFQERMK